MRSRLTQARGLKQSYHLWWIDRGVAPHTGAWIETQI